MSKLMGKGDLEIISFAGKQLMYDWMTLNHETYPGIWLRMYKKASGKPSVVWKEAVEVCLCFGWIDGMANSNDDESYLQRLTPRRSKSVWSKINCATAERLIAEKLMRPAGLMQVEAAKDDGRWERAYDSPKTMVIPEDFIDTISKDKQAFINFEKLKKSSLYTIGYSLNTAKKPETRQRRLDRIIEKLQRGETI